jgi:mono/diheme cytochrome c family protein
MKLRTALWAAAAVVVLVGCAALAVFLGAAEKSVVTGAVRQPLPPERMKALAERGAYVAVAADCYACHTAKGGAPWAGGMPFETPFGTIYSTNISPDSEHGIGNWTRAEFHRAMRDGIGKGGKHLYPAMPYASYRLATEEDVDAVYAFLMTRAPMKVANKANAMTFPFNIRQGMTFWNLLNLGPGERAPVAGRSPEWNRGRYLVDALAHCGECHTPRNLLQGMNQSEYLKGAVLEGAEAPDITRDGLSRMGFDAPTLARFMKSGIAVQGAMTNQMFDVVHLSTQYMTDADMQALSAYLFDLDKMPAESTSLPAPKPVAVPEQVAKAGRESYLNLCSGCHGGEGQGIPHVSVPLATNASLRLTDSRNLVRAVLHGIPAQRFPGLERMQPMPGFGGTLDDRAVADLATWLRARWGGQQGAVTPQDVAAIRSGS